LVVNGSFESGIAPWTLGLSSGATAVQSVVTTTAVDGTRSDQIQITKVVSGCAWCVQVSQTGLALKAGVPVTVSFSAKASSARSIQLGLQQNGGTWKWYSFQSISITTGWATYSFTFTPTAADAGARMNFNLGGSVGTVWIDKVSMK
jgi:hypothetical protein